MVIMVLEKIACVAKSQVLRDIGAPTARGLGQTIQDIARGLGAELK